MARFLGLGGRLEKRFLDELQENVRMARGHLMHGQEEDGEMRGRLRSYYFDRVGRIRKAIEDVSDPNSDFSKRVRNREALAVQARSIAGEFSGTEIPEFPKTTVAS